MLTICYREFINLMKSIKSLLTILIMIGMSYGLAFVAEELFKELTEEFGLTSLASLMLILLVFGFFFVFSTSHDILSREIHNRTARFLVTKVRREEIVLGKFLGLYLYWFICILITSLLLLTVNKQFVIVDFIDLLVFMTFPIALCLLVSLLFPRPGYSMFIGFILSFSIPIISLWSISSTNIILKYLKFLTPYYYSYKGGIYSYLILVLSSFILCFAIILFRRKEL
ncbi:ABC transporter permease subunit [Bacillus kwashiorkori]|uniref:ABC transporter permease subunit n=1 Tax=Bacillus kwashiorkori TaxID=1522318 RepID=UPI000782562C|nr:ABC transporter permease subunit [Bacillus kwashiorkori]